MRVNDLVNVSGWVKLLLGVVNDKSKINVA